MSNLRIVYDNPADSAIVTATSTAGNLGVGFLKTDIKAEPHRSVGTSTTLTLEWTRPQIIGAVVIPRCNFTAGATMRVRVYQKQLGGELLVDSGIKYPCPGPGLGEFTFDAPTISNSFSYGSDTKAVVWLAGKHVGQRVVIDITDPNNPDGYLDMSRLIVGSYWEPTYNGAYGATYTPVDTSENYRTEIGDLRSDRQIKHNKLNVPFEMMPARDRTRMTQIVNYVGITRFLFVSLFPDQVETALSQDTMVYGKRENSDFEMPSWNLYSTTLTIVGW